MCRPAGVGRAERWLLPEHGMVMGVWGEVAREDVCDPAHGPAVSPLSCVSPLMFRVVT